MDNLGRFVAENMRGIIGGILGFFIGILIAAFGFLKTILIVLFAVVGYLISDKLGK